MNVLGDHSGEELTCNSYVDVFIFSMKYFPPDSCGIRWLIVFRVYSLLLLVSLKDFTFFPKFPKFGNPLILVLSCSLVFNLRYSTSQE